MAKNKFKLTAFARFFIFIIVLAPLAYLGASFYNGQDGIQNIKDMIGIGTEATSEVNNPSESADVSEDFISDKLDRMKNENKLLEQKNNDLHLEIKSLKEALQESQNETEQVKAQLKTIKEAIGD